MNKSLIVASTLSLLITSFNVSADESCGKVSIADMNWNSASLIANVDRFILEQGYGCEVELVPGDTMPTGVSMIEKGEPDIAPEMWSNSMNEVLQQAVEEKRLRFAGESLSSGGEQGFWVPKYMVDEKPELATIKGIIANATLFTHPEDPDKYAFMGCPSGWSCQITSGNNFKALKLGEAGFELIDPGSSAGLSGSIARAYERREPWFGYYWAPTAILGKYKMVKVDFGTGIDEKMYHECLEKVDCENPKASMWPATPVRTITTESFASKAPAAYEYLTRRSFGNKQMNQLLAWMEDNQADGEQAMEYFLTEFESDWSAWVSEQAKEKIKQALAEL